MNSQVIRYEGELKAAIQLTNSEFMSAEENFRAKHLRQQLDSEQQLLRCLELAVQRLPGAMREQYIQKVKKYKQKVKQHEQFFSCRFDSRLRNMEVNEEDEQFALNEITRKRNLKLEQDKMLMMQNQMITDNVRNQVQQQGRRLRQGMQRNKGIQHATQQAQSTIGLIQKAIWKRKIMFSSLCLLLILAIIGVIIIKLRRVTK